MAKIATAANAAITETPEVVSAPTKTKTETHSIRGFRYNGDFAVVTFGNGITAIIGERSSYPISEMMQLKAASSCDLVHTGERIVNGTTYQRYRIDSINY